MRHQKIELLAFVINSDEYPLSIASVNRGKKRKGTESRGEKGGTGRKKDVYAALR